MIRAILAEMATPIGVFLATRIDLHLLVALSFVLLPTAADMQARPGVDILNVERWAMWDGAWIELTPKQDIQRRLTSWDKGIRPYFRCIRWFFVRLERQSTT